MYYSKLVLSRSQYKSKVRRECSAKIKAKMVLFLSTLCLSMLLNYYKTSGAAISKLYDQSVGSSVDLMSMSNVDSNYATNGSTKIFSGIKFKIDHNFLSLYTFGKRKKSGINICHWNAGSSYLVNKINEIEAAVLKFKPHIFGISESSFHQNHLVDDIRIEDYTVHFAKTLENSDLNVSRISVFVHNDVQSKVRLDLMSDKFSSIWIEIGHRNQRKILVCNLYREWRYLNQVDDQSRSFQAQEERWKIFISQWEQALNENKEVVVIGDVNLDFLKWNNQNSMYDYQKNLSNLIFENIFPYGVVQCIDEATHYWPGREPGGLDHLYTNHPERLSHPRVTGNGGSDHKMIMCTRFTRQSITKPRIITKRSYKYFDPAIFLSEVRKLPMWQLYNC